MLKQIIKGIACYTSERFNKNLDTILWLHGYTMTSEIWEEIWPIFDAYNHIAIDIPGHGNSIALNSFKNLPELTAEVASVVESFHVQHLIGVSFGGILGLQLAVESPEKYKSLTLISSPYGGIMADADAQQKNRELMNLYKQKGVGPWLTDCWLQSPPAIFSGIRKHPQALAKLRTVINKHSWEELKDNGFSIFTMYNQYNTQLKKINFPVYLFVGEDDLEYIKRCNQVLLKVVKNCKRVYIPNCGHLPLFELPDLMSWIIKENLSGLTRPDNSFHFQ